MWALVDPHGKQVIITDGEMMVILEALAAWRTRQAGLAQVDEKAPEYIEMMRRLGVSKEELEEMPDLTPQYVLRFIVSNRLHKKLTAFVTE